MNALGLCLRRLTTVVSSAGGLGVLGGLRSPPSILRSQIAELKAELNRPDAPFGVDLAIPQLGGGARLTNVSRALLSRLE